MNYFMSRKMKSTLMAAMAFAVLVIGQATTRAAEVFISGFATGCFSGTLAGGCTGPVGTPSTTPTNPGPSSTLPGSGLTYDGSSFSGTTAGGFRALGGAPNPPLNVNNLGSFTLTSSPFNYNTHTFALRVTFTAPQGMGADNAIFSATLTGMVTGDPDTGGVFIDFDNTPILFTFNDTDCSGGPNRCGSGSFFLTVNDLAIDPGQFESVTGQITGAQQNAVPEPATLLLLGTGLSGVAAGVRRKRRQLQKKE